MLVALRQNQQVEAKGGGANASGTYPGYAVERSKALQAEKPVIGIPTAAISPDKPVVAKLELTSKAIESPTTGRELRRVVNASLRAKQLQALGQLMLGLQASQAHQEAEQLKQLRLQINNDDALIALLLAI